MHHVTRLAAIDRLQRDGLDGNPPGPGVFIVSYGSGHHARVLLVEVRVADLGESTGLMVRPVDGQWHPMLHCSFERHVPLLLA